MSKVFELAFKLGAELTSSFDKSFTAAQKSMAGLQKSADTLNSVGKKLSVSVTAPVLGLGAAALKIGTDFDSQMSKVAAVSGATGQEFDKLRAKAQELGSTTKFTATQAAEGLEYLSLAGYNTEQQLSSIDGLLSLAAAANMELGTAADITTDVMSAFGMAASEAGHAADVFAYAQANANTNVEQMGEAMKYAAPMANQMGWSIEETSAAMMKLADNGLKGSIAGQAFASSVGRLSKLTPEAQKHVDRLGISFFDANDNMKSIPDVIAELERGTAGLTMKQKTAALTTIFGAEAYKHWAILLESGSDTLAEHTKGLENSDGTAKRMADTMVDNLAGSLLMLRSALEGIAIQFSDLVKDDIRAFADGLTVLAGKFSKLDDSTKKTILIVTGIAAAIGPVMIAMSVLINSFINVRSAIAGVRGALAGLKLVMMANPILLVVGALVALAAGLYIAYQKSEEFRNVVDPLLSVLKNVFVAGVTQVGSTVSQIMPTVIEAFKSLATPIIELGSMILPLLISAAQTVFPALVMVVQTVAPIISSLIGSIGIILTTGVIPAISSLLQIVQLVFPIIQFVIENALILISGIVMAAMALLKGDWSGAWEIIKSTAETIMDNIVSFFSNINLFEVGKSIINSLIDGISSMAGAVVSAVGNVVPDFAKNAVGKVMGKIPGFAVGGVVSNPTLAWVGEGGDTESIIPWNNSQRSKDLWLQTGHQLGMLQDSGALENMQHQVSMQMQANESPAISSEQVIKSVPNNGDSKVIQLHYSPQYNVQNPEDLDKIKQYSDQDKDDLEARLNEISRNERRKSFGD